MPVWLHTDEAEEAVKALEAVAHFARDVPTDLFAWRWTVLTIHNAVQGFMVIALRDSAGLLVLRNNLAAEWLAEHEARGGYPEERLDSFMNLYKKIKKASIAEQLGATPFTPAGTQGRSIKLLDSLRNQFIHFLLASWSLDVSGLPHICLDALEVVEYLAKGYRHLVWHDDTHPPRIDDALKEARATLESLEAQYRGTAA